MQINPFGFPLGAGMQPAPAFGATNFGFADALGVAIEGGVPQQPLGIGAPSAFDAKPGGMMLGQPQPVLGAQPIVGVEPQPVAAAAALPTLQQPTALSQLMATAAKLPTPETVPAVQTPVTAEPALPDPAQGIVAAAPTTAPQTPAAAKPATETAPLPAPAPAKNAATTVATSEPQLEVETEVEAQPDTIKTAPKVQAGPVTPRKGTRLAADAAQPAPAQPDTNPVATATLPVPAPVQQIAQQQQAPRDLAAEPHAGSANIGSKKLAGVGASGEAAAPTTTVATENAFSRVVSAAGGSAGGEGKPDAKDQSEARISVPTGAKADAAPAMPQVAHTAAHAQPVAALAAEPVIQARPGHLGQSLGVEIARSVDLGQETLRVRLNPAELGRVEVTLAFNDSGNLQATVRTESAHALDLLRQDAPDLQRTLDQAGVRTDAQSFRFESRTGDGGGQQAQQQPQNRGRFVSSDDDAAMAEAIYRPVRSDGQVDLLA